jgi:hypothetical protein
MYKLSNCGFNILLNGEKWKNCTTWKSESKMIIQGEYEPLFFQQKFIDKIKRFVFIDADCDAFTNEDLLKIAGSEISLENGSKVSYNSLIRLR